MNYLVSLILLFAVGMALVCPPADAMGKTPTGSGASTKTKGPADSPGQGSSGENPSSGGGPSPSSQKSSEKGKDAVSGQATGKRQHKPASF